METLGTVEQYFRSTITYNAVNYFETSILQQAAAYDKSSIDQLPQQGWFGLATHRGWLQK